MQGIRENEDGTKSVLVGGRFISLVEGANLSKAEAYAKFLKPWKADDDSAYMDSLGDAVANSPEAFKEYIDSYTAGETGVATGE